MNRFAARLRRLTAEIDEALPIEKEAQTLREMLVASFVASACVRGLYADGGPSDADTFCRRGPPPIECPYIMPLFTDLQTLLGATGSAWQGEVDSILRAVRADRNIGGEDSPGMGKEARREMLAESIGVIEPKARALA